MTDTAAGRPAGDTAPAEADAARLSGARAAPGEADGQDEGAARTGAGCAGEKPAMRIALFMGAGASVAYGMPTTRQLQEKIKYGDLGFPRKDLLDPGEFPDIEHVLSALNELLGFAHSRAGRLYAERGGSAAGNEHGGRSERVRSTHALSMIAMYRMITEAFRAYAAESADSKEIIERLIVENYKWDASRNEAAGKIIGALSGLAMSGDGIVTIFTTNYDTAVEEYCKNSGQSVECVDGFAHDPARREISWTGEFVPRDDGSDTRMLLFKLHGSMTWQAGEAGGRQTIVQKPDTSASDDPARDLYIRPSLDAKDEATQREPYAAILREFSQRLPSFDACVVIGYSFRDPHISGELAEFAKSGKILVVLSPTAAADFENNALKGGPAQAEKTAWKKGKDLHVMSQPLGGRGGAVYAVNEELNEDRVDALVSEIRSLLNAHFSGLEAGNDGEGSV